MRPTHLLPVVGLTFALFLLAPVARSLAQPKPVLKVEVRIPPRVELPVTRVVLFNAGIGYFHREGDITGDARLDLRFEEADINDLLKSLVLTDKDGGKVRAVTYDNRMPIDATLKSFAVDVTENPTVGQLLHQVRGEKVEVADKGGVVVLGQIVSVERPPAPPMGPDPGELLNVLTDDGLQTLELKQMKKIKFVRVELQDEFKKALTMLAASRGDNKKAVSIAFSGAGKRHVAVGYVTESPLWQPSYRLSVDEKGAARIQGWATVENTTDEDWNNVKVSLVAGRPMSFQMDLYDPLFVPRPTVEPESFASLRPPMYQGGLNPMANMGGMIGIGGFAGGFGGGMSNFIGGNAAAQPSAPFKNGGGNQGIVGFGGGLPGGGETPANGGGMQGFGGFGSPGNYYPPRAPRPDIRSLYGSRLSYLEYVERLNGKPAENQNPAKAVRDPLDREAGALAAADRGLGDIFEYAIEEPITLPRQKSALLPIVQEPVEVARVSIYNAQVLGKHPLLGMKLINKTKLHLAQGPMAVYENGTFAGDARLPDLKPNETRLISYAIDLGTEVLAEHEPDKSAILAVQAETGWLRVKHQHKFTTKYLVRNRNVQARTVIVEHPIAADHKLILPEKPTDRSREFYRFEIAVKPGELASLTVEEEMDESRMSTFDKMPSPTIVYYSKHEATKPELRDALVKYLDIRGRIEVAERGINAEQAALKEIADDQDRIRKNLERVPKESDAFKRYLKKFDEQETEIEKRQTRLKELRTESEKQEKALRDFAESIKLN